MMNLLEYKGYSGTVNYSAEDDILFGNVVGINGLISYEGDSVQALKKSFEEAVDDYLEICNEKGIEPEKVYRGSFNVRISPSLHKKLALFSVSQHQTLNATVERAISEYLFSSIKDDTFCEHNCSDFPLDAKRESLESLKSLN